MRDARSRPGGKLGMKVVMVKGSFSDRTLKVGGGWAEILRSGIMFWRVSPLLLLLLLLLSPLLSPLPSRVRKTGFANDPRPGPRCTLLSHNRPRPQPACPLHAPPPPFRIRSKLGRRLLGPQHEPACGSSRSLGVGEARRFIILTTPTLRSVPSSKACTPPLPPTLDRTLPVLSRSAAFPASSRNTIKGGAELDQRHSADQRPRRTLPPP